jgi:hypothetical protein
MRSLDRRIQRDRSAGRRDARGTVRIRDFGDEVHLWFKQRVPWPVALEILRELKAPGPALDATRHSRHLHPRRRTSPKGPAERSKERRAA